MQQLDLRQQHLVLVNLQPLYILQHLQLVEIQPKVEIQQQCIQQVLYLIPAGLLLLHLQQLFQHQKIRLKVDQQLLFIQQAQYLILQQQRYLTLQQILRFLQIEILRKVEVLLLRTQQVQYLILQKVQVEQQQFRHQETQLRAGVLQLHILQALFIIQQEVLQLVGQQLYQQVNQLRQHLVHLDLLLQRLAQVL